jgi:hypothetical protein
VQVLCLVGNDLYRTADDLGRVLPGQPAAHFFQNGTQGAAFTSQPDPTLAAKRAANANIGPPSGPRNSFPRVATDSDGTVYLAFRTPVGTGLSGSHSTGGVSVGSVWTSEMVYFDGAQWHGPGVLAFTDAVSDNRPAILALAPGRLLIAHSSDHRLSPLSVGSPQNDGVSSDVFQSDLTVARTMQPAQLQRIGTVTPASPDAGAAGEQSASALSRGYRPRLNGQSLRLMRGDFHRHTDAAMVHWWTRTAITSTRQRSIGPAAAITTTERPGNTPGG